MPLQFRGMVKTCNRLFQQAFSILTRLEIWGRSFDSFMATVGEDGRDDTEHSEFSLVGTP